MTAAPTSSSRPRYLDGVRELDWDGLPNVRDLGGLPTPLSPSGRTLPARVARGPRRELLTGAGWAAARAWGLRTVVDLRCADEAGRRPGDPHLPPGATDSIAVLPAPTEDHTDAEFRAVCFPILDSPAYWRENWRILPGLVRATLGTIAAAEPGVLVHCSAGRDRTGMVSALLLANAGVPVASVVDDYARSVRAMAGTAAHAPPHDRQAAWDTERTESWLARVTPVVADAARNVAAVLHGLGVAPSTRRRLRDLLTAH